MNIYFNENKTYLQANIYEFMSGAFGQMLGPWAAYFDALVPLHLSHSANVPSDES